MFASHLAELDKPVNRAVRFFPAIFDVLQLINPRPAASSTSRQPGRFPRGRAPRVRRLLRHYRR